MSVAALQGTPGALPPSAAASEPSWVRGGSEAVQHAYQEGVGFEEMLLERLTQGLAGSAGLGGEGAEGEGEEGGSLGESAAGGAGLESAGSGLISSVLPGTLAESVVAGGGLGLADQMAEQARGGTR